MNILNRSNTLYTAPKLPRPISCKSAVVKQGGGTAKKRSNTEHCQYSYLQREGQGLRPQTRSWPLSVARPIRLELESTYIANAHTGLIYVLGSHDTEQHLSQGPRYLVQITRGPSPPHLPDDRPTATAHRDRECARRNGSA